MFNVAAFLSYVFLTAYTPGPNNIMAMSNASNDGFKKSFRFCLGVLAGFFVVVTASAVFSAALYDFIPKIEPFMRFVGAAYILWLAWTILRDKPKNKKGNKVRLEPNCFFTGMVMQFVNVKVILYGITTFSTLVLPYFTGVMQVSFFVLLLTVIGFSGTCCWAMFGSIFSRIFAEHKRGLNVVMALLLGYCAISILL
ncbi:LysE family transporter [Listeria booriae]|uniref:LysE family transporter n=1 Tax=Listeria booriae TaxID=1552123 RepID=A0A7X1CC52_9LIST|nr:LysE family transporter [Listeria booriae]MBC1293215.1 LysE family transporter [Listeria booriae]MBC1334491.1 LysE family transporter [Listeria booriae]MBC1492121.1 LysE family transporter [Listeria booriae]MBC1503234.1 LysE family transporter [Listeria booriae]MBC1512365.1 LysE family transporter [Listeria booriae]